MSGALEFHVIGEVEVRRWFQFLGTSAQKRADIVTVKTSEALRDAIRAHASGRPGPDIITGDYWASWDITYGSEGDGLAGTVASDALQANRLENGFYGTDSLGRLYHQPPFPHVAPAIAEVEPLYGNAVIDAVLADL